MFGHAHTGYHVSISSISRRLLVAVVVLVIVVKKSTEKQEKTVGVRRLSELVFFGAGGLCDWSTRRPGPGMTSVRERVEEARRAEERQRLED